MSEKPVIHSRAASFNDPLLEGDELEPDTGERLVWPPPDVDLETFTVVGAGQSSATAKPPAGAHGDSIHAITDEIVEGSAPGIAEVHVELVASATNRASSHDDSVAEALGPITPQRQPTVAPARPLRGAAHHPKPRTVAAVVGFVTLLAIGGGAAYAVVRLMQTPVAVPAAGTLTVESQPSAATVAIDGVTRGTTPVRLSLAPGRYQLDVRLGSTTRRRPITIGERTVVSHFIELSPAPQAVATSPTRTTATPTAAAPAPAASIAAVPKPKPAAGSLRVSSPIALDIFEGGELIGSADERITLRPGRHTLTFVNRALNFEAERQVTVASGKQVQVSVDLPDGTLHVNALPWAEVFVDGDRYGETPLGGIALRIGGHQVTLRNPEFGERSMSITVKSGELTRLSVDLRK